ncbi:MAG: SIS domain-containing protein [Leptolinea sp.]|nr:SIS domain-containing protein [Leptolinea sp.]
MGNLDARLDHKIREMTEVLEFTRSLPEIPRVVDVITAAFEKGHHLFAAGNGGGACNADQMIGEFVGRFRFQREPYPAFSIPGLSGMTAIGNDFGFDKIYARQVLGCLKPGDVFIGFSCSGTSPNILEAVRAANNIGVTTIGFSGWTGRLYKEASIGVAIPPCNLQTLEEVQLILTHIICEQVEERLCANDPSAIRLI